MGIEPIWVTDSRRVPFVAFLMPRVRFSVNAADSKYLPQKPLRCRRSICAIVGIICA